MNKAEIEKAVKHVNIETFDPPSSKVSISLSLRQQLIAAAKIQGKNTETLRVFKSINPGDYSLTVTGFISVIEAKLFPFIYVDKLTAEEISIPNTLITLNKIFDSPFFISGSSIYYFDEIIHAQKNFYKSMAELIKVYKD